MKLSKPVLTGIIILACVSAVLVLKKTPLSSVSHSSNGKTVRVASHFPRVKGNPNAPIKIVEYTDFQCPACAKGSGVLHDLFQKYPDKIYLELKYFPLAMHQFAMRAAIYAECASEQNKFWPFQEVLFKSQESWSKMTVVEEYYSQLAVSLGMDGIKLSVCVNGTDAKAVVEKDVAEGQKLKVNSTPTFFVNGKMVVGGKQLTEEIEARLKTNGK